MATTVAKAHLSNASWDVLDGYSGGCVIAGLWNDRAHGVVRVGSHFAFGDGEWVPQNRMGKAIEPYANRLISGNYMEL